MAPVLYSPPPAYASIDDEHAAPPKLSTVTSERHRIGQLRHSKGAPLLVRSARRPKTKNEP
ncbi:hypothetical protein OH77DRAFT_1427778 [Trametes cingulata]|nr:hypothetical protein OH77DRAFT_1427778 [Trametes cingulata]